MKHIFTVLLLTICSYPAIAQNLNFQWARNFGGIGGESGSGLNVDAAGNVYIVGVLQATVDFDPGPGTSNLTSTGQTDAFILKLDANGNLIWVKQIGGAGADVPTSMKIDASGVYVTGQFNSTADFDPGAGSYNLTPVNQTDDIFVCKLDLSGNFLWAKSMGGPGDDDGLSIFVNATGVYTTGRFNGAMDIDPGAATTTLTSVGNYDVFACKLNLSGDFVWGKSFGGTTLDIGYDVCADDAGNAYVAGHFRGTVDFDPGAGTNSVSSVGLADGYILKLDAAGNFAWVKVFSGASDETVAAIEVDATGVYTTGYHSGTSDFDPNAGTISLTDANTAAFASKLDLSGNYVWAKNFKSIGPGFSNGYDLALAGGNVYITGRFSDTVDVDPGPAVVKLVSVSVGNDDFFATVLDPSGNFVEAVSTGGRFDDFASSIAVASGNVYLTGGFAGTTDFDPGPGVYNLTPPSNPNDVFILKLGPAGNLPITLKDFRVSVLNGSAKLSWVTAQEQNSLHFDVEKSTDAVRFNPIGKVNAAGNTNVATSYIYSDNKLTSSAYYRLKLVDADGKYVYSNVLQVALNASQSISVFPNPVESTFSLQLNKPKGIYNLRIYNTSGQLMYRKTMKHAGGNAIENIQLNNALPHGVYKLELQGEDGRREQLSLVAK